MMKKIALILMLALLFIFPASAEPAGQTGIEGLVLEYIAGEHILLDTFDQGQVLALVNENTEWDGAENLSVGDYIYIDYDGKMTRSLPAQITALTVRCHVLEGEVAEYYADEKAILINTEAQGEVYVRLPADFSQTPSAGDPVKVYFNGAMTLSLPGQVNAGYVILGSTLQGEITQLNAESLLMNSGDAEYQVNFEEGALPECTSVGDVVRVIYDGKMTYSLPAQVFAQEIIQLSR